MTLDGARHAVPVPRTEQEHNTVHEVCAVSNWTGWLSCNIGEDKRPCTSHLIMSTPGPPGPRLNHVEHAGSRDVAGGSWLHPHISAAIRIWMGAVKVVQPLAATRLDLSSLVGTSSSRLEAYRKD